MIWIILLVFIWNITFWFEIHNKTCHNKFNTLSFKVDERKLRHLIMTIIVVLTQKVSGQACLDSKQLIFPVYLWSQLVFKFAQYNDNNIDQQDLRMREFYLQQLLGKKSITKILLLVICIIDNLYIRLQNRSSTGLLPFSFVLCTTRIGSGPSCQGLYLYFGG